MESEEQSENSLHTIAIIVLCCGAVKMLHLLGVITVEDKADDDLEMTVVCHRPEGLDQLEAQTNFSKRELQVLYRGFKNECPSGVVNEDTFKQIYSQFFPHGDASTYAHYLFNAFDTGSSGSIMFEDFVSALSILLRGSVTEKLQWTFNLYDINRDGYINKEEMTDIVRAIYDMMGKYTYPVLKNDAPKQHVDAFFQITHTVSLYFTGFQCPLVARRKHHEVSAALRKCHLDNKEEGDGAMDEKSTEREKREEQRRKKGEKER
ncbi:hypothetical protein F2P81_007966 [Scophthalmus maximus]|uniref:EF-hand domain-containing protein n=1 Tax=Scophthalmus maximus TaxID=52904 RepID=A0A6A4T9S1_SCOMX|nr:hypothetical protein F2P81_007966 [Scophthalmus maximus]